MRRTRGRAVIGVAVLVALTLAGASAHGQVIIRPQPGVTIMRPTFEPPYRLTIRVFVTPYDARRVLAPGQGIALRLTDAEGRRLGMDPDTGTVASAIPRGTYEAIVNPTPMAPVGPRGQAGVGITIDDPRDGTYLLEVIGQEPASYEIAAEVWDRLGRRRWTHLLSGTTERGAVDRYDVRYSAAAEGPVDVKEREDDSSLLVRLYSVPLADDMVADLLLTDPRGHRLGHDPATPATLTEIPRAAYGDVAGEPGLEIEMGHVRGGRYVLDVIGRRRGRYDLAVYGDGPTGDTQGTFEIEKQPIGRASRQRYVLDYSRTGEPVIHLEGGYGSSPRLLTFVEPIDTAVRLRRGERAYPLLLFYGAGVARDTFLATLNGADVTAAFGAAPGTHQLVRVQVGPGTSTLVLSVRGTAPGVAQTERIVLIAR